MVQDAAWQPWKLNTGISAALGNIAYEPYISSSLFSCQNVAVSCSTVDQEIGAAIQESGIPRSVIFVTMKFWPHFALPDTIELCLDKCLKHKALAYV